ncbi:MAG: heavy metal translocating P-type ATPase [Chloroflexi bacterium]|jgi:Cd2+/Zn2+-exporting ATPase|nr:heavy metal translocating P-type ATPase [Chloroflexota bacterium]
MTEKTVELAIPLLLTGIEDEKDQCFSEKSVSFLETILRERKGIYQAHLEQSRTPAHLCIHYNPNLISLQHVRQLAEKAGASFTQRYRHEQIPFIGLDSADSAYVVEDLLDNLPGMLHASVSYAAGLIFAAYDTQILDRSQIDHTLLGIGVRTLPAQDISEAAGEKHIHGSAPTFLPHWVQERWSILLVAMGGMFLLAGWAGSAAGVFSTEVALVLYLLSYFASGYDIATHAIPSLFKGKLDTDVLMLAAALGAAALGEWAEGGFLLLLFSLGHLGEHYALDRARSAINELGSLLPRRTKLRTGDRLVEVSVEFLRAGDIVVVAPGERIPVDGIVRQGISAVDQSPITGESMPVPKKPGSEVFAGTVNQEASLDIEALRLAKDTTLSRVMQLVTEAQSQQSPIQQMTARFTSWFVPSVLILVVLTAAVPPLAGWMPFSESFYRAMLLLVAASPCALAVGTPAAALAGVARAARNGVLIKGGVHLENLGKLNAVAFDKTGTLTTGRFEVCDIITFNGMRPDELLSLAGSVEQFSNHPLASAVVRAAQERSVSLQPTRGLENMAGLGVRSEIGGQEITIGSLKLFTADRPENGYLQVEQVVVEMEKEGKTTMVVRREREYLGVLALADTVRPQVSQVMDQLKAQGVRELVMLTGDNPQAASRIARQAGVTRVEASLLPEDKLVIIDQMKDTYGSVGMVGDGVNDAPALAAATVGIAMGGAGSAAALETADVALMADDLSKLPFAVGLGKATRRIIAQNLAIAIGVIVLLIFTSVLGLLPLSSAVFLHEGSTLLVVLNALRLLRYS